MGSIIGVMANATRLHWGILGTARINRSLIGPIKASKKSQLWAVASRDPARAAEYAKTWGIPRFYSGYEALLSDPEIEVVYISLPNSLHAEWSIRAMQRGKHVLCEKPLTISIEEFNIVQETAIKTGMVIAEAFMYRHHPQTLIVKEMVDRGEVGNIQMITGSFCYTNNRPNDPRFDPALGGGSLWDVGSYPIGYARFITGEEPIEVYGNQVQGSTGVDVIFAGQLRFSSGIVAQFDSSFISPPKSVMEITGEKGRLTIPCPYKPGIKEKITTQRNGQVKQLPIQGKELYLGEVEDLENAILFGKPTRISLEESKGNIQAIQALYTSARTLQAVHL